VHNGPAYSLGPCDCGATQEQEEDWGALAEKQLASIKRDTQASFEDAMVRATHKVMAELEAQPAQEPPSEWAGIKAILDEYGLQAIDFVADFKAALAQPPLPVQDVDYWIREATAARQAEMAMRRALEAQPAQEPVGQVRKSSYGGYPVIAWDSGYIAKIGDKFYTAPPKCEWVGLTAEEIASIPLNEYTLQIAERLLRDKNT
jgi:hypothetical protein